MRNRPETGPEQERYVYLGSRHPLATCRETDVQPRSLGWSSGR